MSLACQMSKFSFFGWRGGCPAYKNQSKARLQPPEGHFPQPQQSSIPTGADHRESDDLRSGRDLLFLTRATILKESFRG